MPRLGQCLLGEHQGNLVDSHIIPNSFYRPMMADSGYATLVSNVPNQYDRRLPTGLYDPDLVCEQCERLFSPSDNYGKRLLLDTDWSTVSTHPAGSPKKYYVISTYDYPKFKLFFMSVLWRMAATARPEFKHIDLGPHLPLLRAAVHTRDPGTKNDWSVVIGRFTGPHSRYPELDPRHCWLDPHRTRFGGSNCIKMYMAEFTVYVKVDRQDFSAPLQSVCLSPDKPLFVAMREFETSPELRLMHKMSRADRSIR